MKRTTSLPVTIVFAMIFSASCGVLRISTKNKWFLKDNPTFKVVDSQAGEGWDGVSYHTFWYKKPDDEGLYMAEWTFVQQDDGSWRVTRGKEKKLK